MSNMKINDADDRSKIIENNLMNLISYTIYYNFVDLTKKIFKNGNKLRTNYNIYRSIRSTL